MRKSIPKIKSSLSRAIEHELRSPGELASYLEYLHLLAASREVDKEDYQKKYKCPSTPA